MRIQLSFYFFCLILFFFVETKAQALVNWAWQENNNVSYVDLEYKNGFVYTVGNFTASAVVVGTNTFTNNGSTDFIIAKYDTLGNVIWANHYGGNGVDVVSNLTVDSNENICVVGTFNSMLLIGSMNLNTNGGKDIFMAKLNSNGIVQMAKNVGGIGDDFGVDIATDNSTNIYILGNVNPMTFANTICPNSAAVAKYDYAGNEVFLHWIEGTTTYIHNLASPYYDAISLKYSAYDSTLVLGGVFGIGDIRYDGSSSWNGGTSNIGSFNNQDIYLAKIKKNGIWSFLQNTAQNNTKHNMISDICIDNAGSIYYGWRFQWTLNGYSNNYWAKCDINGNNVAIVAGLSSGNTWVIGSPGKMFYNNHIIYGLIVQSNLTAGQNCSDYYAMQFNTLTNSQSYITLGADTYSETGVAGVNGNYFLGGNNSIGKSCSASCLYPSFSINPAPDVFICPNSNVQIGSTPCFYANGGTPSYNYSWQPTTGLSDPNISNPFVANISSNMTYTVTITDQNNNIGYDTINVTMSSNPVITSSYSPSPFCVGIPVTITLSGGSYYHENPYTAGTFLNNPLTLTPTKDTLIEVMGYNTAGCFGSTQVYLESFKINAHTTTPVVCNGSNATLISTGANTYNWMPNNVSGDSIVVPIFTTTVYTVTGTSSQGCNATGTTTVFTSSTLNASANNSIICLHDSIQLMANGNGYALGPQNLPIGYCLPPTTNNGGVNTSINNFKFNDMSNYNNGVQWNGYADFTNIPFTTVESGNSYAFEISRKYFSSVK